MNPFMQGNMWEPLRSHSFISGWNMCPDAACLSLVEVQLYTQR